MKTSHCLLSLLLAVPLADAGAATVLKCLDHAGNVTYTEGSCPPGQTLERQLEISNPRPSGTGPAVPLATPRPPAPEPERPRQTAAPKTAPVQPPETVEEPDDAFYPPYPYYRRPQPAYRPWPPQPPYPHHPPPPRPPEPPEKPPARLKGIPVPWNSGRAAQPERGH